MIKGWFKDGNSWYYMNLDDGAMLSGQWIKIENKEYYLSKSGIMAKHCYVKSEKEPLYYWIDSEGVYQKMEDTITPDLTTYELVE